MNSQAPILQQLQNRTITTVPTLNQIQSNPMLQNIKSAVGFVKAAQDPYSLIQNALAQQNPALVKAYNSIVEHGGDYKAAMNDVAAQMGIDRNAIMSVIN